VGAVSKEDFLKYGNCSLFGGLQKKTCTAKNFEIATYRIVKIIINIFKRVVNAYNL